ncbi:MAG: hypothetical protein AAF714_05510 [Pseudomonadota bacterium]
MSYDAQSDPRRMATFLAWVSTFALFAYPAILMWQLLTRDLSQAYVEAFPALTIAAPPEGWRLWSLLALDAIEIAVTLAILWQVRCIFRAFAHSAEPTADVARRLSKAGMLLVLQMILAVLVRAGESVLLTLANAPGMRQLSISLGSTDLALLIAAGLLICTGRALAHGAAAMAENRGFI